jgi:OmpA-OmpF porin, OOP family
MKNTLMFLGLMCFLNFSSQDLKPTDKLALLNGVVTNFKGKPLGNEVIIFVNENNKSLFKTKTDAAGKFQMLVPVSSRYNMKYKNFTTEVEYTVLSVPADADATYEVEIKIDPPKEFVLKNVFFDTGKSVLKPASNKALDDLVEILKIKNTMIVEIQGHTDNVGDEGQNIKLSQERADAVRNFLILKGISAGRISAKGYGSAMPVADNASDEGRSKNRRTSLKVIKE